MRAPRTDQEAENLVQLAETHYSQCFIQFQEDDSYYEGDFENLLELPNEFPITLPTTGRAIVDEAVDNIDPEQIQIVYPPRGDGPDQRRDADDVRQWLGGVWKFWRHHGSDIDPIREFAKNLCKNGKAAWKIVPDYTLYPSLSPTDAQALKGKGKSAVEDAVARIKRLREQNFLLTIRNLPGHAVMEDPTVNKRKQWVIERYSGDTSEVQDWFAAYEENFRDIQNFTRHQVHEIWTAPLIKPNGDYQPGRHYVLIDRAVKFSEENPYEFIPYIIRHSGFGTEAYNGAPELKAVGFYTPQVRSMLEAEARRHVHFDAIMSQMSFPVAFVSQRLNLKNFSLAPGAINKVPDEVFANLDKLWVKAPIPQPEYMASLASITDQIERGTTQRAIRGAGVPGTRSAAQLSQIVNQARLRLDPVRRQLESAVAEANEILLQYVDQVEQAEMSVFVAEKDTDRRTVGPAKIKGRYVNSVQFMPAEEAIKERKLVLASDARAKGNMSRYDSLVYAGFEDVERMIARADADALLQEPEVKRFMAKQFLKEMGIDVEMMELEEEMKGAQAQVVLRDFANMIQSGSMRGVGDPMSPNGAPPPGPNGQGFGNGGQQPAAAMAQFLPQTSMPAGAPSVVEQGSPMAEVMRGIGAVQGA